MAGRVENVQIGFRVDLEGSPDDFWTSGPGARLESMYAELLGFQRKYVGYHKLVPADGSRPEIGFEYSPDDPLPRWPDPEHPQQVHLDIGVSDLERASAVVLRHGATLLEDGGDHRIFADPMSHPFCLYPGNADPGRIEKVVFDCPDPSALARFYGDLLDLQTRLVDTPERVEITGGTNPDLVLAFQRSSTPPPRWPDPSAPEQLHLDLAFDDPTAADAAERLGAVRLPDPNRPDHFVYADPAGHPFCMGFPE
jgi:hypothetical protein